MNKRTIKKSLFTFLVALSASCTLSTAGLASPNDRLAIQAALDSPHRPTQDQELDKSRKPLEVLSFFGIKPSHHILEVFAGPGYYTEILSRMIDDKGSLTTYTHSNWYSYSKKQSDERHKDKRLKNVKAIISDINTLKLPKAKYDAVTVILGLHDMFLDSETSVSGEKIDTLHFVNAIKASLKPGGILGIVEHNIPVGTLPNKSAELHRLDKTTIINMMESAGFVFEAESNVLANNKDDYSKHVFTKENRRKTDRSVLRFRSAK